MSTVLSFITLIDMQEPGASESVEPQIQDFWSGYQWAGVTRRYDTIDQRNNKLFAFYTYYDIDKLGSFQVRTMGGAKLPSF